MDKEKENARKRQLAEPVQEDVKKFPILASIISAPAPATASSPEPPAQPKKPQEPMNYASVFNAFTQFLNGYLQAGGDPNLANTLASYAAALPPPPNSYKTVKPVSVDKKTSDSENTKKEGEETPKAADSLDEMTPTMTTKEEEQAPSTTSPPQQPEVTTDIQRLREAAFGRYKNVLCVICNEWICSRNRKNHIEAHLNYRPYKCSACDYSRRREIFVVQHIKTHHRGQEGIEMIGAVDENVASEVDRLADECVARTRKLIENMQEKKDDNFGEAQGFDQKAQELMLAEEAEKKVVVIESVSEVRTKVANYHRRQRTKVLKKIYDTDMAKQAELKISKDVEPEAEPAGIGMHVAEGFEIKLEDLRRMVAEGPESEAEIVNVKQEIV